jgi:hypothetical protein
MKGKQLGALIGAIGGLMFVQVNAGALPSSLVLPVRVLGVVVFCIVLWRAVLRTPRSHPSEAPPSPAAWRVYWSSVSLGALSIPIGANLLNTILHLPQLTVLWVVFVVGAHFLPFAAAFGAPVFQTLAWTLMGLAAAGATLTLTVWPTAPGMVAVLAGFVLLSWVFQDSTSRRDAG